MELFVVNSDALFVWTYQQNQQPSNSVFLSQQTSEQCFQHNKPAKRTGWEILRCDGHLKNSKYYLVPFPLPLPLLPTQCAGFRDENGTDIFRPYSRPNPFRGVLIRPYLSPDI
jgi:hypothetical protein